MSGMTEVTSGQPTLRGPARPRQSSRRRQRSFKQQRSSVDDARSQTHNVGKNNLHVPGTVAAYLSRVTCCKIYPGSTSVRRPRVAHKCPPSSTCKSQIRCKSRRAPLNNVRNAEKRPVSTAPRAKPGKISRGGLSYQHHQRPRALDDEAWVNHLVRAGSLRYRALKKSRMWRIA